MYKLTATLNSKTETVELHGKDYSDAMLNAISEIMSKAFTSDVWAKGRIELVSPTGEVINTMEAK